MERIRLGHILLVCLIGLLVLAFFFDNSADASDFANKIVVDGKEGDEKSGPGQPLHIKVRVRPCRVEVNGVEHKCLRTPPMRSNIFDIDIINSKLSIIYYYYGTKFPIYELDIGEE